MKLKCSVLFMIPSLLLLLGCGGDRRYQVSGKVTYKGAPVSQGALTFNPDPAKNKSGLTGTAPLRNGDYDTRGGIGISGGAYIVRIDGFDGKATAEQPLGSVIFVHEEPVELPTQDTTKDFVVPANAPKVAPSQTKKEIIVP